MRSRVSAVLSLAVAFAIGLLTGQARTGSSGRASASGATPSVRRDAQGITISQLPEERTHVVLGFRPSSREKSAAPARSPVAPVPRQPETPGRSEPGRDSGLGKPARFESPRDEDIYVLEVSRIWNCPGDLPCEPCLVGACTFPPRPGPPGPGLRLPEQRLVGIVAGSR
jgi:hypothetical protein